LSRLKNRQKGQKKAMSWWRTHKYDV
jgi:hypothetical protein